MLDKLGCCLCFVVEEESIIDCVEIENCNEISEKMGVTSGGGKILAKGVILKNEREKITRIKAGLTNHSG